MRRVVRFRGDLNALSRAVFRCRIQVTPHLTRLIVANVHYRKEPSYLVSVFTLPAKSLRLVDYFFLQYSLKWRSLPRCWAEDLPLPIAIGHPPSSSGMSTFESMSWFSSFVKFPPPHDARPRPEERRLLEEPSPEVSAELQPRTHRKPQPPQETDRDRNKVIFGAGVAFFAFSLLITRRSFARKRLQAHPAFYTDAPANVARQAAKTSGAMEALEALNIATINVLSVTMMATGGALWYMDINSMADARRMLRGGLGVDGTGRDETQAEEEFEEWMATVLSRRDAKEKTKDDASATKRVNERGQER